MSRMTQFSTANPTGTAPGMEPVRLDVLKAAVNNEPAKAAAAVIMPPAAVPPTSRLINKNIRLPADLVDFIDFTYTKDRRMKKQDAYTEALEAYFRPLMAKSSKPD